MRKGAQFRIQEMKRSERDKKKMIMVMKVINDEQE